MGSRILFCRYPSNFAMGQTVSTGLDNDELVDNLVEADYIKNTAIQRIFRAVDRANYFLAGQRTDAYRDSAWRVGNLHLSAPCVYSGVMESLDLRPGLSFLNLGSGCGYLSTMAGLMLGPYGINHGVEIYKDVVDYSYDRLEDFMKESDAVDEYEFCEPAFVNGNCLKIDSVQLYDRVYCGAACPLEYETYMKHLIKVGGILVIPLNNKLLQITRTSETNWESSMILSVSFAPLISPSETESVNFVKLPDFCPPSLQALCRSKIRTVLKSRIDEEHPSLQEKKKERCRNKIHRHVRRIVIPLIGESDSSDSGSNTDIDFIDFSGPNSKITVGSYVPTRATAFIKSFIRARTEIQGVVAGPSSLTTVSRVSVKSSQDDDSNETDMPTKKKEKSSKKDKDDDSNNTYSDISTDDDGDDNSRANDLEFTDRVPLTNKKVKKSNTNSSVPSETEEVSPPRKTLRKRRLSGSEPGTSKSRKRIAHHPRAKLHSRIASVICKRLPTSEFALDSPKKKDEPKAKIPDKDVVNYKNLMAKKILSLPLPMPVLMYMNYRRDNFKLFIN